MIDRCNQIRAQMGLYLDDELRFGERDEFEAHLRDCAPCTECFDQERRLLEQVRASQPLYEASPELRGRVEAALEATAEPLVASHHLRERIQQIVQPSFAATLNFSPWRTAGLIMAVMVLALAGFWLQRTRRDSDDFPRPSDFALMAVDTHLRRLRGNLPLEVISDSPELISGWFSGKVSFSLKLPNYQDSSGQDKLYHLEGARLVAFNNDYAAYIAYKMRQRPITLVVTSNSVAMPSGGEEKILSNNLRFHYDSINGLKVITWADRGLTYALVSDLEERGQQSCLVCHAGTKDRGFIEGLKLSPTPSTP
ncbi:MAG TPA: zf-HC2 domain-containing protein [Blastocatellia bacterium]|nr:zf-HC2 domain-containing protein [Blastocatellia bacterium]